jgi:hypothetical protein
MGSLAMAYGRAGRLTDARRVLGEIEEVGKTRNVPSVAYLHAYIGLGDLDRAFAAFEDAYRERSYVMQFAGVLPLLDPLREETRFARMLGRLGLA